MPSKLASVGIIGAGAYGASLAFTSAYSQSTSGGTHVQQQQLRAAPSGASTGAPLYSTACAVSGVMLLAGAAAHAGTRTFKRSVRVAATGDDEEPAFSVGQRVLVLAPPAMAGKQGNVEAEVGDSFSVRFDSGSVFNILTENLLDALAPAPAAAAAPAPAPAPAPVSATMHVQGHAGGSYEHGEFEPGQRVLVLGPPAMAGKQGTIVGPALGEDTYAVRFDSGSVFNFTEANLSDNLQHDTSGSNVRFKVDEQGASHMYHNVNAPVAGEEPCPPDACDLDELEFQPGERVSVLGPPAMAGKQGTVVGPALGEAFAVRFDTGSVFNILTDFLQSADGGAPATAAPVAAAAAPVAAAVGGGQTADEDELEFQPGQRVLVLAPPAMAGKQATVVGPALGDVFACQFDTGSVFNFPAENLQDAAAPAPASYPAAAPAPTPFAAPAPVAAASAGGDDELEFQEGQNVTITGPPAMAGKRGVIVGPALGDAFAVRFDTGSVFNIDTANIQA